MSWLIGALTEAWEELRIYRLRVLLSLLGVALAVAALSSVTALGQLLAQASQEMNEKYTGRTTTIGVEAMPTTGTVDQTRTVRAFRQAAARFDLTYSSLVAETTVRMRLPEGNVDVPTVLVDQPYGVIHRVTTIDGAWFAESDTDRFAPALVVNEAFQDRYGFTSVSEHPVVALLGGDHAVRATVIGVRPDDWRGEDPSAYLLFGAYQTWLGDATSGAGPPRLEAWVPPDAGDQLTSAIQSTLTASLPDAEIQVIRTDVEAYQDFDNSFHKVVLVIGIVIIGLGAVGLVNISLVTVRSRIREIGIRRSFGATSGRVFFSVLMESVLATVVAGVIGVGIAIVVVTNLPLPQWLGLPVTSIPPFPTAAATQGLLVALGTGALAGFLPALVAVRTNVIDAIRM